MAPTRSLIRLVGLAVLVAGLLACGRGLRGQPTAAPTPIAEVVPPTATARPPDPSPTPIPRPTVVGRTTRPATPSPLGGRGVRLSIALDGAPWADQAGLFIARERGYFVEAGVDVYFDVAASREAALRRLADGRTDLAVVGGLDLLRARGEGLPLVSVYALAPHPLVGLIALRDGGPGRPHDLDGRRVALPDDRFGRVVVEGILSGDGLDPARVVVSPLGADPIGALVAHRLDALGGYGAREGAAIEARGAVPHVFRPEQFGVPDYAELVVATTDARRASQAEPLRAFLAAASRGYAEAARSPPTAVDSLMRANPSLDRRIAERTLADLTAIWRQEPLGEHSDPRWRQTHRWLADRGLTRADLDPATAFTNELLPRPTPTPVGTVSSTPTGPTATPIPRPPGAAPPAAGPPAARQTVIPGG